MRTFMVAALAALVLAGTPGSAQDSNSPFQQVNGDGWIASNARFDGTNWQSRLANRPSFGLQLGEENDIPFEHGTAGATFWVRDAGCKGAFLTFGSTCGWKLAMAVTQFRSLVVGGNGIEIDGLTLKPPYGRIVSVSDGTSRRFGITNNIYADWSGADVASAPRWFAGFNVDRDRFEIARSATMTLAPLASVDADGMLRSSGLSAARVEQSAPDSFATRHELAAGRYTFAFKRVFARIPVCVASSEGPAPVRVHSALGSCTIFSSDARDTSTINVQITGNPN